MLSARSSHACVSYTEAMGMADEDAATEGESAGFKAILYSNRATAQSKVSRLACGKAVPS